MDLFRKCIFLSSLLSVFFIGEAQQLGDFDVRRGVGPYFLGYIRSHQDSSIRLAEGGKLEWKGRTEYSYYYPEAANRPYFLGGVNFKIVLLTYVSDTLVRIMLNNIYTPRIYPDFAKRAKQEFRQLSKFLKEQWGNPGSKKTFRQSPDKRFISKGLQWNTNSMTMKAALDEYKSKTDPQYGIWIILELSRYD